jgi:hypothetical protein
MLRYEELLALIERSSKANEDTRRLIAQADQLMEQRRHLRGAILEQYRDIASLGRSFVDGVAEICQQESDERSA